MSSQKFLNGMYKKLFVNFTENLWGLKEELYYMACRTLQKFLKFLLAAMQLEARGHGTQDAEHREDEEMRRC